MLSWCMWLLGAGLAGSLEKYIDSATSTPGPVALEQMRPPPPPSCSGGRMAAHATGGGSTAALLQDVDLRLQLDAAQQEIKMLRADAALLETAYMHLKKFCSCCCSSRRLLQSRTSLQSWRSVSPRALLRHTWNRSCGVSCRSGGAPCTRRSTAQLRRRKLRSQLRARRFRRERKEPRGGPGDVGHLVPVLATPLEAVPMVAGSRNQPPGA